MTNFKYTALKDNKIIVKGELEAANSREARKKIRILGLIPTKVYTEEANVIVKKGNFSKVRQIKFLSLKQKILFTSQMQTLLSAGIPILDAINSIETNAPDKKIKNLCCALQESIMQDGKIIGAVTHVIMNDVTKGYGIFITNMLEESEKD